MSLSPSFLLPGPTAAASTSCSFGASSYSLGCCCAVGQTILFVWLAVGRRPSSHQHVFSKSRYHLQEPRVTFKWNSIAVAVGHIEWNVITISMKSTTRLSSSSSKKMVLLHQDRYFATALLLICCILTGELTLFMQIYPSFLRLFFPPPTAAAAPHCKYGAMQQQRIVNLLSSTKPFYFHDMLTMLMMIMSFGLQMRLETAAAGH